MRQRARARSFCQIEKETALPSLVDAEKDDRKWREGERTVSPGRAALTGFRNDPDRVQGKAESEPHPHIASERMRARCRHATGFLISIRFVD